MNAADQVRLLKRIERNLADTQLAASQLPGGRSLVDQATLLHARAYAWRCDQEAELPENFEPVCFGGDARGRVVRTGVIDRDAEIV